MNTSLQVRLRTAFAILWSNIQIAVRFEKKITRDNDILQDHTSLVSRHFCPLFIQTACISCDIYYIQNIRDESFQRRPDLATRAPTEHTRRRTCPLFAASSLLSFLTLRFTYPLLIALFRNDTWAAFGERALNALSHHFILVLRLMKDKDRMTQ